MFACSSHQAHTYMHHTAISCLEAHVSSFCSFLLTLFPPKTTPARRFVRGPGVPVALLTLQKVKVKPMKFQHFHFLAPPGPHIEAAKSASKVVRVHFSLSGHIFSRILQKCAPRPHRKHNSEYRHRASLTKNLTCSTSQPPDF